jgi:predicted metal-dependent HD superfamily phosphohydrolase
MRIQWRTLVLPLASDPQVVETAYLKLCVRYGENGRFYHNLAHIQHVLSHIQPCLAQARNPAALQLAAWFHDAVYDPQRHDNEAQSAAYARRVLVDLGLAEADIEEVARLIGLTAGHKTAVSAGSAQAVSDTDGHILIDADLAILAAEPAQYDAYAAAIRREYAHVPDAAYRQGRAQALRQFSERPFLYHLPAHRHWEAAAQANLRRELSALLDGK